MEKRKRETTGIAGFNLEQRRSEDFVVPLPLEQAQARVKQNKLQHFFIEQTPRHYRCTKDAGKNLNIVLDVYFTPISDQQTHVQGEAYFRRDTTLALVVLTLFCAALSFVLASALPFLIYFVVFVVLFWYVCFRTRNALLADLSAVFEEKLKNS
jgi:hypothetical protein